MHRSFPGSIRLLLFLMLTLHCSATLTAQPQLANPFEFEEELYDIAFRDANEGYALGSQFVWRTSDAGATWTKFLPIGFRPPFTAIALFGETGLIIGDEAGEIHVLVNGDSTWTTAPGGDHPILEIEVVDRNPWVAITDFAVFSTIDGGTSYRTFELEDRTGLSAIDVTGKSLMHVSSDFYTIRRSTDGGLTWNELQIPQSGFGELYDVRFTSADTGFVASWYPWNLFTTTDGGATWSSGPFEYPTSIAIYPNGFGAYATTGYIRLSDNGGMTWSDSLSFPELASHGIYERQKVVTAGSNSIFLLLSYRDPETELGRSMIGRIERTSSVSPDRPRRPSGTLDLSQRD